MFIEPTVISIVIAKIRGGRFKALERVDLRGWYLLIFSALLQVFLSVVKKITTPWGDITLSNYFIYFIIISYGLIIIAVLLNISKRYMKVFLIGILLNFIVIVGNGGQMPVSLEGLKGINIENILPDREFDIKHTAVNKDTKFVYLADIILIPKPYPLAKILSIGDIFLMLGTFLFFQDEMIYIKRKKYPKCLKL